MNMILVRLILIEIKDIVYVLHLYLDHVLDQILDHATDPEDQTLHQGHLLINLNQENTIAPSLLLANSIVD